MKFSSKTKQPPLKNTKLKFLFRTNVSRTNVSNAFTRDINTRELDP